MKTTIFATVALLATTAALADGPIAYPGSTWGQVTTPSSVIKDTPDNHDFVYQGRVQQGIDWFKFGDGKYTFDTYGAFAFTVDSKRLWWNDKIAPSVGAKVSRGFESGVIDIGVEGVYEHHFSNSGDSTVRVNGVGVQGYVSYWFGWNLKK